MAIYIEDNLPNINENGLNTTKAVSLGSTLAVTGATTITGALASGAQTVTGAMSSSGGVTALNGTAVPATAGAIAAGAPITMFSTGIKIWVTSDAPTHTATKGDLCLNTGGNSTSTRLYINNGTTNWVAITTAS
jgi:hypothetical protein